jgi:hypothetical protein
MSTAVTAPTDLAVAAVSAHSCAAVFVEQLVATLVAPGEVLEVVRVDNQNAEARTVVVQLLYGLIEALLPKPTVWKIRQFIRGRRLCCACHPFFGRRKDYGWRGGNILHVSHFRFDLP